MSQPVSDRSTVLDPVEPASAELSSPDLSFDLSQKISSLEMEENADSLMDQLFADVDRMLERGMSLPVEPATVEEPKPQPVLSVDALLPPKLAPRDLIPQSVDLPELTSPEEETSEPQAADTKNSKSWSPLWMAVLCSSLLLSAGILCFLFRDQVTRAWLLVLGKPTSDPAPATVAASPTNSQSQKDTDFLEYLGRSLDRLARKSEVEPSPVASASPTVSPSPSVIERVYVPIYPSAQTSVAPSPTAGASPSPVGSPAKPATSGVAASPSPSPAPNNVPNIATAANHTLLGVLELGDRSAALFEVNGTPQRIKIGESIGSSGWTLVSISNQEAIVRRNGEVRSIHVGQKF